MAAAGPDWVDFGLADKGKGLRELCAGLGIHPEEVVAFGDNWNDAAMLETAGTAWLMAVSYTHLTPCKQGLFPVFKLGTGVAYLYGQRTEPNGQTRKAN